ncbi:MAG: TraI domain-containing protein [Spirochaetaceae bacterium]|jgi:hypothetical protein|nr:TraI domain-containing protein [Spirochaetaceae bacterium]
MLDGIQKTIASFLARKKRIADNSVEERADFVKSLCAAAGGTDWETRMAALLQRYATFLEDPASAKYHGNWDGGLLEHSLRVLWYACKLEWFISAPPLQDANGLLPDILAAESRWIVPACLLHDLCKAGTYKKERSPYNAAQLVYKTKPNLTLFGHGEESLRRIAEFFPEMPESWALAVRWHMGAYQIADQDKSYMTNAIKKHGAVLLLQTADMLAGIRDEV